MNTAPVMHLAQHPNEVEMALWFHDSIYKTGTADNEERSAYLAYKIARQIGLYESFAQRTKRLILATKHTATPQDIDAKILTDVDLTILGRPIPEFDAYEANIRKEYAWVELEAFNTARSRILQGFLERETIYATAFFKEKYEAQARKNIERSIARLKRAND